MGAGSGWGSQLLYRGRTACVRRVHPGDKGNVVELNRITPLDLVTPTKAGSIFNIIFWTPAFARLPPDDDNRIHVGTAGAIHRHWEQVILGSSD